MEPWGERLESQGISRFLSEESLLLFMVKIKLFSYDRKQSDAETLKTLMIFFLNLAYNKGSIQNLLQ